MKCEICKKRSVEQQSWKTDEELRRCLSCRALINELRNHNKGYNEVAKVIGIKDKIKITIGDIDIDE